MNVATLARAWFERDDFSIFPPSGDGSYVPKRSASIMSLSLRESRRLSGGEGFKRASFVVI